MMGWHGFPLGGFDVAGFLGIAAVVLLIWGRRLGMRRPAAFRRHHTTSSSALEVAKRRYARGEISRDEFLDIANDLYLTDSAYPEKPKRSAR
ncbi:MAG: hypothetical protein LC130_06270 [Bryobacterales bacterium]|jgi:uncharacterized membrane protein|nr:hypothetical protein [Bryobacterales bacterium]